MIEAFASWIWEFALDSTIVLVAWLVFSRASRQPARRLALARASFVALGASAVIAAAETGRRAPKLVEDRAPIVAEPVAIRWPGGCVTNRGPAVEKIAPTIACAAPASPAVAPTDSGHRAWISPREAGIAAFSAGSALSAAWLGLGAIASARLRARSRPAPGDLDGILGKVVGGRGRAPRLLVCEGIGQPIAMGVLRPTIILPARFVAEEPADRVEAAMAHEWGHIRNGDLVVLAISRALLPILFAHPLYAVLRRRVRADQELLADAFAAGECRVGYAEALLGWARSSLGIDRARFATTLGLRGRDAILGERIAALLDRDFRVEMACPRPWRLGALALAVAGPIGPAAISFRAEADTPPALPARHPVDCSCCAPPPPSISAMVCPADPAEAAPRAWNP